MRHIDFVNVGWTITSFALFAAAVILVARKTKILDRAVAELGHYRFLKKLFECYFCLGFWIIAAAWTILELLTLEMMWRGYFYAFCAAPLVELILTLILAFNANYRDRPED